MLKRNQDAYGHEIYAFYKGTADCEVRFDNLATSWFDYLLASRKEMKQILKGTGWRVRRFVDSPGPQYVAIIEKTDL